jgi:hypothetical protein
VSEYQDGDLRTTEEIMREIEDVISRWNSGVKAWEDTKRVCFGPYTMTHGYPHGWQETVKTPEVDHNVFLLTKEDTMFLVECGVSFE